MTTDTKAPSLKPCPFCGSSEVVCSDQGDDDLAVTCKSCWAHSPFSDSRAFAIAAWNTRATPTPTEARERIALADHDKISRLVLTQPWEVQQAVVTIAAHCTALKDECPTGQVADLAGCISLCCLELAHALATPAPSTAKDRIARLWQDLLDKDDRTSPEEYPDMALITFDEFEQSILALLPEAAAIRAAAFEEAARELERSYPDHAWLNAACAAIRAAAIRAAGENAK